MRAISITITADSGAGGFILPNDRVDVILTRKPDNNSPRGYARKTILSNLRVLAVDQTFRQDKDTRTVVGKTATVEVTPEQAEMVSSAQAAGRLSLALRPLGRRQSPTARTITRASIAGDDHDGPVSVIRYGMIARPAGGRRKPSDAMRKVLCPGLGARLAPPSSRMRRRPALDEANARG